MESVMRKMERDAYEAQANGWRSTHWLMSFAAFDQLRSETTRDKLWMRSTDAAEPPSFMGLPIYLTRELAGGVLIREGEPPDELREAELQRRLHVIQREYADRSRPVIEELAKLEARKPPRPIFVPSDSDTRPQAGDAKQGFARE